MAAGGWGHASGPICGSLVAWRARLLVTEAKGDSEVPPGRRRAGKHTCWPRSSPGAGVPDTGGRHRGGYLGKVPRTLRLRASSYEADHITAGVEFAGALVGVNVVPRSVAME